jgi:hypothetical protein
VPSLAERLQQYLGGLKMNPQQGTEQDYDPNFEAGVSQGTRDITNYANQLDLSNRQNRVGYEQQMSDLGRQRGQQVEGLTNRMAGQGLLHSGINIGEQGKIGENYQRAAGEAATGLANAEQENEMGFTNSLNSFRDSLGQLQGRHAQYVTERQSERAKKDAERQATETRIREEAERLKQIQGQIPPMNASGQFIEIDSPEAFTSGIDWDAVQRAFNTPK